MLGFIVVVCEPELVGQVLHRVAVVVDHDFVQHVVVELEEVRPAVRRLQRDVVGDEHDFVRAGGADKGVRVRVVGQGILADEWRLAMTRRARRGGGAKRHQHPETQKNEQSPHPTPPAASKRAADSKVPTGGGEYQIADCRLTIDDYELRRFGLKPEPSPSPPTPTRPGTSRRWGRACRRPVRASRRRPWAGRYREAWQRRRRRGLEDRVR